MNDEEQIEIILEKLNEVIAEIRSFKESFEKTFADRNAPEEEKPTIYEDFFEIVFNSRVHVEQVAFKLKNLITYGPVTVCDYYNLAEPSKNYASETKEYGWTSLETLTIRPTSEGYMIQLPKPVLLERKKK
jgi:hypothetical protein